MAITNNVDLSDFEIIQKIIEEVLLKRKYKFNIEGIKEIIKKEIIKRGIEPKYIDCSMFDILVLNTINKLVNDPLNPRLYKNNNDYIPVDYIIFKNYQIGEADKFLYYVEKKKTKKYFGENHYFIDIQSGEIISSVRGNDIVLCGGVCNDRYKTTLQSNVDYKEIKALFDDFLNDGASKTETINYILNYYKVSYLSRDQSWGRDFIIKKKKELESCKDIPEGILNITETTKTIGPKLKRQRVKKTK